MMLKGATTLVFGLITGVIGAGQYYAGYQEMLTKVNEARQAAGKGPICNSEKLMESALKHSTYQAGIQTMTHDSNVPLMSRFSNEGFSPASVAENVAETPSDNVAEVMNAWLASPHHKENIIGDYTHFGSAPVKGNNGQYYWTQHFAKSTSSGEACMDGSTSAGAGTGTGTGSGSGSGSGSTPASPSTPAGTSSGYGGIPSGGMPMAGIIPDQATPGIPTLPQQPGQVPGLFGQQPGGRGSEFGNNLPGRLGRMPGAQGGPLQPGGGGLLNNQTETGLANLSIPSQGPKYICVRGRCYTIVLNQFGEGFVPSPFRPPNMDISGGPVMV